MIQKIKDMKKRIIFIIIITMAIIAVTAILIDNSHKVKFEDEIMAELMAKTAGVESVDELREDDLEQIEILNIGYTGYYNTLVDIEKCPNLKRLVIGYPGYTMGYYPFADREMPKSESKKRVKQIEQELERVLEKCPNLEDIYLSNEKGNCELDNIEFLRKGKNLKSINLFYQTDIDYSVISECRELKFLSFHYSDVSNLEMISKLKNLECLVLTGTNVSEATDILKLEKLTFLRIANTPLSENEKQLELIQKQFPELKIQKDYEW